VAQINDVECLNGLEARNFGRLAITFGIHWFIFCSSMLLNSSLRAANSARVSFEKKEKGVPNEHILDNDQA
jgi:hypothetical protein